MGLQIRDVIWKPKVFLEVEKTNMYRAVVKQAKSMTLESERLVSMTRFAITTNVT